MDERINEVVGWLNPEGRDLLVGHLGDGSLSWLRDALGPDQYGEFATRVRRRDYLGAQALLEQENLLGAGLVEPRNEAAERRRIGGWVVLVPLVVLLAFLAIGLRGCDDDDNATVTVGGDADVVEVVGGNPNLSSLQSLIGDAGLAGQLRAGGPFTLFAPTNAALAGVPGGLDALRSDKAQLAKVLSHHIIPARLTADLLRTGTYTTLGGDLVAISVEGGKVRFGGALVTQADQQAANGVVHSIDGVALDGVGVGTSQATTPATTVAAPASTTTTARPTTTTTTAAATPATTTTASTGSTASTTAATPKNVVDVLAASGQFKTLAGLLTRASLVDTLSGAGPFTIFGPSDAAFANVPKATLDAISANADALKKVLTYHVVAGSLTTAQIQPGTVNTLNGEAVTLAFDGPTLKVNSASVTQANISAPNGVIHAVDNLLIPANLSLGGGQAQRFSVFFDVDVDTPNAASQATVDQALAAARAAKAGTTVILTGYADVRGDPASNLALSKRRADNVAAALTGAAPNLSYLVNAKGDTEAAANLDQSRRVDILIG